MQRQQHTKEEAAQNQAFKFLKGQNTAVLSTISEKSKPDSAVIYYELSDDFVLSFITKTSTAKYENISANKSVAVCVYDEDKRYTIQAYGVASESNDEDEKMEIISKLAKLRHKDGESWLPPVARLSGGNIAVINVKLQQIKMADFKKFRGGSDSDLIENIELAD